MGGSVDLQLIILSTFINFMSKTPNIGLVWQQCSLNFSKTDHFLMGALFGKIIVNRKHNWSNATGSMCTTACLKNNQEKLSDLQKNVWNNTVPLHPKVIISHFRELGIQEEKLFWHLGLIKLLRATRVHIFYINDKIN